VNYPFEKEIFSEEETGALAKLFAGGVNAGDVIVLNGELGAGKTFFVKHAAAFWKIKNVCSPSFAIVNSYNGSLIVYHFDFYRIKNTAELFDIGFNDYLNDSDAIIFIEWGNLFPDIIPKSHVEINIEILKDNRRKFKFNKYD
jgi:tRNA threonylcarbamoyladenosine biosynthesis protein TsaE